MANREQEIMLVLHDVRSVHNVGAIFRTADAVGVSKIILSGVSPSPIDRFGRKRIDFKKTALGAEESVPWEVSPDVMKTLHTFKQGGFSIFGVEQDERSVHYRSVMPPQRVVLILGSETEGLPKDVRDVCDALIEIPMRGIKESLNVSVAAGIVLYGLFDREN